MSSPISPDIVYKLRGVGDPALSPDGTRLAYAQSWIDQSDGFESRSRIMMLGMPGGEASEFTQGNKDSLPKFSPDGRVLAFLRPDDSGKKQVWRMEVGGGEARALTNAPGGVTEYSWSTNGQRLVFRADVEPEESVPDEKDDSIPRTRVVSRIRYRYDTLGWRGDAHHHLFVVDADGENSRQITDGDWDDQSAEWSPDGESIAFLSGRRDDRDFFSLTELYVVPAGGGEAEMRSQGLSGVGALTWSPDGKRMAVLATEDPDGLVAWQAWLYVVEPGKVPQRLTDDSMKPYLGFPSINQPPELSWTGDDRILFLGDAQGESFLYEVPADGGQVRTVAGGGCQTTALTLDRQTSQGVILSASPGSPGDLFQINIASGAGGKLTGVNREYLDEHPPATMEKFSFERAGFGIECRLWFPPDFQTTRNYPLLLDVHGGPNGAFYDSFNAIQQVLATAGYLVLAVNPRGSSTYGDDFMKAVLKDWGGEDYLDLMAAVDLVSERPYVDSDRLGIHGYSYGGFMTSWTVGHDDRFRAAVVGAPCTDLYSMYGTSDIGISFGEVQWGGSLFDAADELIKHSPITYAKDVSTPVLLLHGEADNRCPISQSEEYFTVLKRLGKEVEFVRFPDCSHLFLRVGHPKMRAEYLSRTLGWFDKWLA